MTLWGKREQTHIQNTEQLHDHYQNVTETSGHRIWHKKYKHMHNLRIVSSVKQSSTVYMACCTLAAHRVLCRTHNSTCLWIIFELTYDTNNTQNKNCKQFMVWRMVQTDISSSNSTRWGSPQYGRYWLIIIIFTNLYWSCKLQHKKCWLYFDVVVLCRTHNSTRLWFVFELTHDVIINMQNKSCKLFMAQRIMVQTESQTEISSSNSTRWGLPQYGRYWLIISDTKSTNTCTT